MANIEEVGAAMDGIFDPTAPGALANLVQAAVLRADQMQTEFEAVVAGSEAPQVADLREHLTRIAYRLGTVASEIGQAVQTKDELLSYWGVEGAGQKVEATRDYLDYPAEEGLFDSDVQSRLDTLLRTVLDISNFPRNERPLIGSILNYLHSQGMKTVRDILATGQDIFYTGLNLSPARMGESSRRKLQGLLVATCPEVPLRPVRTDAPITAVATRIAQFCNRLDQVPIQAVFPEYRHVPGHRVTVADLIHPTTGRVIGVPIDNQARLGQRWHELQEFIDAFKQAHE